MVSINALSSAVSGLNASQANIDTISNNVVNASTEGYTRKTAEVSSSVVDFSGIGVRVGRVSRYVDETLIRDFRLQTSVQDYLTTRRDFLEPIAAFHGSGDLDSNFHAFLSDLQTGFVQLSSDPNSSALQRGIVRSAENYAETFNNFAETVLETRQRAEDQIDQTVDNINQLLREIEFLNRQISPRKLTGDDSATLEDQRDLAAKNLSEFLEITYFEDGSSNLVVQTNRGNVLVDQTAQTVSFDKSPINYGSSYPQSINGVIVSQGNNIESVDLASFPVGGKLGALFELRDQDLPVYQAYVDELAHKTAQRFEQNGLRLFTDSNGVVPPDDPTQYFGFAATIQVNERIVEDPSFVQRGTNPANGNLDDGATDVINDVIDIVFGNDPITQTVNTVTTTTPAATPLSAQILASNPVAYYRLDEGAGTVANNLGTAGAGLNGTFQGGATQGAAPLYTNGGNQTTQFDGVNDVIAIPDSPLINLNTRAQRTVELVFNADTTAGRQVLYEEGATVNSLGIYIDNGNLYVAARDSGEWGPFNINTPITAGTDYHVSFVLDTSGAGTFTGYLNGVAFGFGATPTSLDPHSGDIGIGAARQGLFFHDGANGADGFNFQGRISDVAIYNTALTQAELQAHSDSLNAVATTTTTTTGGGTSTQNFRTKNLGFFANINLDTAGNNISLFDFASTLITRQTGDFARVDSQLVTESSFTNDLQNRLLATSGVNVDEELGRLIEYRQSYSAASQMIVTLDELFQDLLFAFS